MKTKKQSFKCVEDPKHVEEANITQKDILDVLGFFTHFDIPTKWNKKSLKKAMEGSTVATRHDVAHMVMDDLVTAFKKKNEVLQDPLFKPLMIELEKVQAKCKAGKSHE